MLELSQEPGAFCLFCFLKGEFQGGGGDGWPDLGGHFYILKGVSGKGG